MRYLLLLLLLPLTCFGQFGGFRTDQPFLAKDASLAPSLRDVDGLAYWWVASDLGRGPVSVWTDRIQGVNLVQSTASKQPTATTNEVVFNGTTWLELTNTVSLGMSGVAAYSTNSLLVIAYSPKIAINDATTGGLLALSNGNTLCYEIYDARGGVWQQSLTGSTYSPLDNYWISMLYGGYETLDWTNGIAGPGNNPWNSSSNMVFQYVGRIQANENSDFVGKVREIAIWTNRLTYYQITNQTERYLTNTYTTVGDSRIVQISADYGVSDAYGAAATNGAKVATWTNVVGYGDFTQGTAANQGYFINTGGPNGKPYVRFPNTNSASASGMSACTATSNFDFANGATLVMVIRIHPQTGVATIFDSGLSTARHAITYTPANNNLQLYAGTALNGPQTIATNVWYIFSAQFFGANSLMRTNAVLYASGNAGNQLFYDGLYLNDTPIAGDYSGKNNDWAEFRYYTKVLSSNQLYSVESELATKYGITIP